MELPGHIPTQSLAHLDDVLNQVKTFAHNVLGMELRLGGEAGELDAIARELALLNEKIAANGHAPGQNWDRSDLVETGDEMISIVAPGGNITWVNNEWKKALLYDDEDIKTLNIRDVLSQASKERLEGLTERLASGRPVISFSATFAAKNGAPVDVVGTILPLTENGVYTGSKGFFKNITGIRKERAERIKAETRLQRTFDHMLMGCMAVGFDWAYLYVNEAAARQVYQVPASLVGKKMNELLPQKENEHVFFMFRRCMEERVRLEFEGFYTFHNGLVKWFEFQAEPTDEGIFIMSVDITENKEAGQQLEAQNIELKKINDELDRFVYSTSHDLRAPLMSLLGLIDLSKKAADPGQSNLYYQMMRTSIHRIDNTIKEILTLSQNARMKLTYEQLDLKKMLNNQVENIMNITWTERIVLMVNIEDDIPFCSDKLRVTTLINNLMINAVKYQREEEEGPYVKFTFVSGREEGLITVEDNGEGIAADKLDKVFEMFYRNSEKSVGSGLGLYICHEIVHKLGGSISVQSEHGKGSTFTVRLPNHYHTTNKNTLPETHTK